MRKRYLFVSLTLAAAPCFVGAQPSAFSIFANSDSFVHVRLTTDMRQLTRDKFKDSYQTAKLEVIHPGDTTVVDIQIRGRGNVRREVCHYPPLRFKFPKRHYTYNKIKWVNTCRDTELYESLVLKEYLAYKLYRIITDRSLDVHLIRMEYRDIERPENEFMRYGFVIEPAEELADRYGGRVYKPRVMRERSIDEEQLAVFYFFQFMIGNTDWALANLQNLEIITNPSANALIPVAYDFDYSGLVDAPYAVPHSTLPIDNVTIRHNKGYCISEELAESTRHLFLSKKEEILEYCRSFAVLNNSSRRSVVQYMEAFFKIMDNPRHTARIFSKDCSIMK